MKKNIIYILIGLFLIGNLGIQNAVADPEYNVNIDMVTYVTPADIKNGSVDVNVKIIATDIPVWAYPLTVVYFYEKNETLTSTVEYHGYDSFNKNTGFTLNSKPDSWYKNTEVQIFSSNKTLIARTYKYEPVYLFSQDQNNFTFQVESVGISEIDQGISGLFKENLYEATYTIRNTDNRYAFKGTLEFGDLRTAGDWKTKVETLLGPGQTIEIKRSAMTFNDLNDMQTLTKGHSFLVR